jgi:2-polyprenyl-6-methoxyphenol hydroxylase-like FAD-dependent oxidoreductase
MYEVFEDAFPQMKWRELVPQEVMERYAASQGGTFPAPQYCTALTWEVQQSQQPTEAADEVGGASLGVSGVVLLGDAAHCFPPDLGQGVNSSLEDVCVLEAALEESGDKLGEALKKYQERRQEDTAALAKLVQVRRRRGGWCRGLKDLRVLFRV